MLANLLIKMTPLTAWMHCKEKCYFVISKKNKQKKKKKENGKKRKVEFHLPGLQSF